MTSNTLLPAVGELLQRCVIAVHEPNDPPGTGAFVGNAFFVQPDLVLTCAHVLRDAGAENAKLRWPRSDRPNGADDVIAVTSFECYPTGEPYTGTYPFPDLAIIHVKVPPGAPVDWVLLGHDDPAQGTRVFARGISRRSADTAITGSTGLTLQVASYSADNFLRVRSDRVEPGMSGSPVVEPSTGQVIGMVKASRHLELELGGFVLPISAIRSCLDGVLDRQYEEEAGRRWYTALRTPLREQPLPKPPAPVRYAAYYLVARESLSFMTVGAALLLGLLGVVILLVRPADSSADTTGVLALGLVGCATVALAIITAFLIKLARWFRTLSEGLLKGRAAPYRKAMRWTAGELIACAVGLLVLPKSPLPMAAVLIFLALVVGTLHSLRRTTVRQWCHMLKRNPEQATSHSRRE